MTSSSDTSAAKTFERRARRVRRALRRVPALQRLVDLPGVPLWRWQLRRGAAAGGAVEALPEVIEVDPRSVELALPRRAVAALGRGGPEPLPVGLVRGGRWDRQASPLPRSDLAAAASRHMGGAEGPGRCDPDRPWNGPVVAFDRRGRLCLVDGADRLAAAAARGEAGVPALVAVRHRAWARIATEVRAYTRQRGGTAYQPYLHPDLADLPSDQGHERFDLLRAALPVRGGTLVDLGANSGYFSHRFEELGFDCVAVERSAKEAHFLAALRDAAGRRFTIVQGSLTEVALPERPDVVLALNIFHHFLKEEASFRELEAFLGRLEARFLFFGAHLPSDPQMAGADRNMDPAAFTEWVRRAGGFASAREIGRAADGRPVALLAAAQ